MTYPHRARAAARSAAQHGLLATWQADPLGLTRGQFRASTRGWIQERTRVLRDPAAPRTSLQRIMAGVLTCGPDALATGHTALRLLGLRDAEPGAIDVLLPHSCRVRSDAGIRVVRSRTIPETDRTVIDGIPSTTAARTIYQLTGTHGLGELRGWLIDARQRRLLTLDEVLRCAVERVAVKGRRKLLYAAHQLDPAQCDSVLSQMVTERLLARGIPLDLPPVTIRTPTACFTQT